MKNQGCIPFCFSFALFPKRKWKTECGFSFSCRGRSSGLSVSIALPVAPYAPQWQMQQKHFNGLTAAGTAPDFNRIPFSTPGKRDTKTVVKIKKIFSS